MKRPRLFISYSHQPPEHKERVEHMVADLGASDALEIHGDFEVKDPQGPAKGWIAWMREQLEAADWILVVCNSTYRQAWEKRLTEGGRGATYEAALLMHELYTAGMVNRRLIPVTLGTDGTESVPMELQDFTRYHLPADRGTLVSKILGSTWLGRFVESLAKTGGGKTVGDVTPSRIFAEAKGFTKETELRGTVKLREALIQEADEFHEAVARATGAAELERLRQAFRRSFCPKVRELLRVGDALPPVLEKFFDNECGS